MPIAVKNGHQKTFTDTAWRMLGKQKNGWELINDSVAENLVSKQPLPDSGQKAKPTVQVAENLVGKEEVVEPIADVKEEVVAENVTTDLKAEFLNVIKENNITKNQIKNFLDSREIQYQTKDNLDALAELMYDHLNGNIAELKLTLSI